MLMLQLQVISITAVKADNQLCQGSVILLLQQLQIQ